MKNAVVCAWNNLHIKVWMHSEALTLVSLLSHSS